MASCWPPPSLINPNKLSGAILQMMISAPNDPWLLRLCAHVFGGGDGVCWLCWLCCFWSCGLWAEPGLADLCLPFLLFRLELMCCPSRLEGRLLFIDPVASARSSVSCPRGGSWGGAELLSIVLTYRCCLPCLVTLSALKFLFCYSYGSKNCIYCVQVSVKAQPASLVGANQIRPVMD